MPPNISGKIGYFYAFLFPATTYNARLLIHPRHSIYARLVFGVHRSTDCSQFQLLKRYQPRSCRKLLEIISLYCSLFSHKFFKARLRVIAKRSIGLRRCFTQIQILSREKQRSILGRDRFLIPPMKSVVGACEYRFHTGTSQLPVNIYNLVQQQLPEANKIQISLLRNFSAKLARP